MSRRWSAAPTLLACSLALGLALGPRVARAQCVVSIPSVSGTAGNNIDVHVMAGELTGLGVTSFRFWVRFDPTILEYISSPVCYDGVVFPGDTFKLASAVGDEVHVAAASSDPFSGSGCLFRMRFKVRDAAEAGACSPLEIVVADMLPERPCSHFDGQVCVGQMAQVSLTPQSESALVGDPHTVVAQFELNGSPAPNVVVTFEVLSGPNAGKTHVAVTDGSGRAPFSYASASRGTDLIRAEVPRQGASARRRGRGVVTVASRNVMNPCVSTVVATTWVRATTDVGDAARNGVEFTVTPNPFSERVDIRYSPRRFTASMVGSAWVDVYNARGRLVRRAPLTLSGNESFGFAWDGFDESRQRVPAGIYLLRVRVPHASFSTKILRITPTP